MPRLALALALPALALAACVGPPTGGTASHPDAGAPDAAPPLRHLEQRPLFGASPVENRFLDPSFGQVDGFAWGAVSYSGAATATVTRLHIPTPGGQPAVRLVGIPGQTWESFGGEVKSTDVPFEVSIWVGLETVPASEPQVSLTGLYGATLSSLDLAPEAASAVTLAGVTWRRFSLTLDQGPVAWSNLDVVADAALVVYLTAPVLAPTGHLGKRASAARPRPLTKPERDLWDGLARGLRDRLGRAPTPLTP